MIHPDRSTMFSEYYEWTKSRNYPKHSAYKCLAYMEKHKYDIRNYKGLYQLTIRLIKNTKDNQKLDNRTFEILQELNEDGKIERIDQTIYSYLLNTEFLNMSLYVFNDNCIHNDILIWNPHGKIKKLYKHNKETKGYVRNRIENIEGML